MSLDSMQALLVQQLGDLQSAESQLSAALPRLVWCSRSPSLAEVFRTFLGDAERRSQRLTDTLNLLGSVAHGRPSTGMSGLLQEAEETLAQDGDPGVIDAGLVSVAQRVTHYFIAGYATARSLAATLGHPALMRLLDVSLREASMDSRRVTMVAAEEVTPVLSTAGSRSGDWW